MAGWRAFTSAEPPAGWKVVDGALVRTGPGGDPMTADQVGDFELQLEWKITKGGNSGIMCRVTGDGAQPYETGPEFQVLDNAGHEDGKLPLASAGSNDALHAPVRDVTKPVGEWNAVRLVVQSAHEEHWMNAVKLLEYELWSPGLGGARQGEQVQRLERLRPRDARTLRAAGSRRPRVLPQHQDQAAVSD